MDVRVGSRDGKLSIGAHHSTIKYVSMAYNIVRAITAAMMHSIAEPKYIPKALHSLLADMFNRNISSMISGTGI